MSHGAEPVRTLVAWCRDWPVVALDRAAGEPVAVVRSNRVLASSASARVAGVMVGLRRREAQRRCPEVIICEHDPDRDARVFDRVIAPLDDIASRLEIVRPGVVAIVTRGPSRYFGGDEALAERVRSAVGAQLVDPSGCGVGIADGPFPATLAAQRSLGRPGAPPLVVAPGSSPGFVAPFPTTVLASPGPCSSEFVDVLIRLGLVRLSDLAALPAIDVADRFGIEGAMAHRLARGLDERAPREREPLDDLAASIEVDPPADRVDQAAFAGKALADQVIDRLSARGLAASRVVVVVHTTAGAVVERSWRDEGMLTAASVATRIRWQLDGWLSRPGAVDRGGVCRLELRCDDVGPAVGRQDGLWGGTDARDDRARRAAARLMAMVGANGVCQPERAGGRGPRDAMRLVPLELVDARSSQPAPGRRRHDEGLAGTTRPWPGSIGGPPPTVVFEHPVPAEVCDDDGRSVSVSGRGVLSARPTRWSADGGPWVEVSAWAGPWLIDERWWDPVAHRRRARFQIVDATGAAHLIALEAGRWWLEGTYD